MNVLISGAGIAGPALAFWLARTGARITVLEKATELLPHGQNVDVQGSARMVLRKMGLFETIKSHNTTEKGTQFIGHNGKPFAFFPMIPGTTVSMTSELEILRGDIAKVLWEATKDLDNVEYRLGTTITQVLRNGPEDVQVQLSTGEKRSYDLLVVADGQWSKVRKQVFPAEMVKTVDKGAVAIYWTSKRTSRDNEWWNIFVALGRRVLSVRPDPYGTIRACFTFMPTTDDEKRRWKEAARADRQVKEDLVRRQFADAGWEAQRLLEDMREAPDFYFQQLEQIKMSQWSMERVVCLGDTAHAPTPLTGAGTSLALDGAYVLAGEISKLQPGEHPARALQAYEAAFKPFVEKTQDLPSFVPGVVHPQAAWHRWLIQTLLWFVSKAVAGAVATPWLRKKIGDHSNDLDFPLPSYPLIEGDGKEAAPAADGA